MWQKWLTLLLVCCALVSAEESTTAQAPETLPVATTRSPPLTLDRKSLELAWKTLLQSPESGNQNSPPRRITTKSLFITPLVCPKGQRLDRNGCVQVVTVNKDEHERILLEQLNALFTSAPSGDLYDYGDGDDINGPQQFSIPIGLDPQAAPLQGQEPSAQAHELQANYVKIDKKDDKDGGSGIEAELEILKLQGANNNSNPTKGNDVTVILNSYPDKPKRDSTAVNATDTESDNTSDDVGQKEIVFGHVNVDPVLYDTNNNANADILKNEQKDNITMQIQHNATSANANINTDRHNTSSSTNSALNATDNSTKSQILKKDGDQTKLNPENDYSDIGEAIKLISRYAEVTTDDNFSKDQKKYATKDESILGTRTKLQHRRNRTKESQTIEHLTVQGAPMKTAHVYSKDGLYFRYPWPSQNSATPPADYPFRHLQDYWPGRSQFGGVYNTHENPRRHHHSYPHNLRPHGYPYVGLPGIRDAYPEQLKGYIHRVAQHHAGLVRPHDNNQDLYSLLGLRHWFSSEGTSKR